MEATCRGGDDDEEEDDDDRIVTAIATAPAAPADDFVRDVALVFFLVAVLVEPNAHDDRSRNEAKFLTLNLLLRLALLDVAADTVVALASVCAGEYSTGDEAWEDSADTVRDVAANEDVMGDKTDEAEDEAEDEVEVKEEAVGGGEDEDEDEEAGEGDNEGEVEDGVEEEAEKDEWADDLR